MTLVLSKPLPMWEEIPPFTLPPTKDYLPQTLFQRVAFYSMIVAGGVSVAAFTATYFVTSSALLPTAIGAFAVSITAVAIRYFKLNIYFQYDVKKMKKFKGDQDVDLSRKTVGKFREQVNNDKNLQQKTDRAIDYIALSAIKHSQEILTHSTVSKFFRERLNVQVNGVYPHCKIDGDLSLWEGLEKMYLQGNDLSDNEKNSLVQLAESLVKRENETPPADLFQVLLEALDEHSEKVLSCEIIQKLFVRDRVQDAKKVLGIQRRSGKIFVEQKSDGVTLSFTKIELKDFLKNPPIELTKEEREEILTLLRTITPSPQDGA